LPALSDALEIVFLEDGAQPAEQVAGQLAEFIDRSRRRLEIAIYDLNLSGVPAERVRTAIRDAAARGVAVRIVYNVDLPNPLPVPPPAGPDDQFIASLQVPVCPVAGVPALMHHKYAIRDQGEDGAALWTGSTNWTNDSWAREENVIVRFVSSVLAQEYGRNFEELWNRRRVEVSGRYDFPGLSLTYAGAPLTAHVYFSPGRGRRMAHVVADRLGHAQRRIRLASPVITDGPILGTLADFARRPAVDFKGVYDRTQMAEALSQWRNDPHAGWKVPAFAAATSALTFASKVSTPWAPGSVHDYMHAKLTVVDDTVLTGSYNLSHSGEENAENLLELRNATLAELCAAYVDRLYSRYSAARAAGGQ
jgi:phosphatidylserine/phosphatidylglycerophosphate/cardiolipin synthase-like enzyme